MNRQRENDYKVNLRVVFLLIDEVLLPLGVPELSLDTAHVVRAVLDGAGDGLQGLTVWCDRADLLHLKLRRNLSPHLAQLVTKQTA